MYSCALVGAYPLTTRASPADASPVVYPKEVNTDAEGDRVKVVAFALVKSAAKDGVYTEAGIVPAPVANPVPVHQALRDDL